MTKGKIDGEIQMIPVDQIEILNDRARNKKTFYAMTDNITKVGLKRPITVRHADDGADKPYELVCGQGRLESFIACKQKEIPAMIIDVSQEDALLMGLVENDARRKRTSLDLFKAIDWLKSKGYDYKQIAQKTGLSKEYTGQIIQLMERGDALKQIGETEVTCLISSDDEAYTYNKHVNHISPIQKHRMVKRAIEKGVSEEKIAQALGEEVKTIVLRTKMLDGICPEAIEMLKDQMVTNKVFGMLKKVIPMRQIEMATLMNDAGHYSHTYAKYLMASTQKEDLVKPDQPKKIKGISEEQMARMENEMANLDREYRLAEETYSADVLNLTLAKGYLTKLLENTRVVKYMAQYHNEILSQFQSIADIKSLSVAKNSNSNTVSEAGARS